MKNLVNVLGVTVGLPLGFLLLVSEWIKKGGGDEAKVEFGEWPWVLEKMVGGLEGREDIVLDTSRMLWE